MKKALLALLVLCMSFAVFAQGAQEAQQEQIRTVLLTDSTGIDDKSFNAAAWRGIVEFYGDNGAGRGVLY